jgi:uncharacterized protein (DUF362 family)
MSAFTRRGFLGSSLAGLAGSVFVPWRRVFAAARAPDVVDVAGSNPETMVAAALSALGGIGRFVRKGDAVAIKPNAAFANPPEWATTTSPATVVAVARACLDAGAGSVTIVEHPQARGMRCLERCGLVAALASLPAARIKLLGAEDDWKTVTVEGGVACKSVDVAKAALSADVLISVPVAKAHNETGVSFGLKNAMGLIRDRQPFHTRFDLHQGIADLARVVKPQLTIIDATRALLTNGPAGPGETAAPGRIVAGANVVSVDAYALTVARFSLREMKADEVRHIALAAKSGLGVTDVKRLSVRKVHA